MPLAGQNTGQIRLAGTGHLYVAPVGTAAPADTSSAWSASWQDLGYTTDTGVTFSKKDAFDQLPLWQVMVAGRVIPKSRDISFKFELVQMNAVTLPLWGGGGAVALNAGGTTEYTYDILPTLTSYERALGIEFTDNNGAVKYRLIVARGMVTDTTDVTLSRTKAATLGVTFECLAVDSVTPLVHVIGLDANLVP